MNNRIKEALEINNMKEIELSKRTGMSKSLINNWTHQRNQPKPENVKVMAEVLKVSPSWLAGYDEKESITRHLTNLDDLIITLKDLKHDTDFYGDGFSRGQSNIVYHIRCPYSAGDKRADCYPDDSVLDDKKSEFSVCYWCKLKWLTNRVDD